MIQTGVLYLSSIPPQANVYLGKSRYAQKTPATIRDLLPGDYFVKLALKGYKPWQNTLTIKAGKATAFERILLIPQVWRKRELSAGGFRFLMPLSGTDLIILAKSPKLEDYYVYNCQTERALSLLGFDPGLKDSRVLTQFSVEDSQQFIIGIELRGKKRFLLFRIKEERIEKEDITDLIYEQPLDIIWDPGDNRYLFLLHKQKINRLDVENRTVYPNYAKDLKGYGLDNKRLYILDKNYALLKSKSEKNDMEPVKVDLILRKLLSAEKGILQIKILSEENFLFQSSEGELLINLAPYLLSEDLILGTQSFRKGKSLLFWSRNRIGVINYLKEDGGIAHRQINLQWLYAKGAKISQCFLAYEDSHIIFRDKDQVFLAELGEDNLQYLETIVRLKDGTSFYYNEDAGNIYFIEPSGGKFCAIKIVPEKESALTPFPDTQEQDNNRGKQGL